ncbi:MAG: ABC transporter ATP-binding protein [Deltaproteobacteria bacterium]|nr:ABC transporter ATP-binding protein [Deltaproteobacteria bacterium]
MSGVLLRSADVCMEFVQPRSGKRISALDRINLHVEEGEFVSLVGPSGCGKTTFLSIVDGLLKPTSGEISLNDRPIAGPGRDRAMVFQSPALLPWRTVLKNVAYGLECQAVPHKEALPIAKKFIDLVGLTKFQDHYPHELSGGMQQRANLARALAVDPDVLLMDEPFAALDAQTREVMQGELLSIWQKTKKTVLFVTHQIDEAVYLSDRVIVFSAHPGAIKESIPIEIERPRAYGIKRDVRFLGYQDHIWRLIEKEVKRSMEETAYEASR